MTAIFGTIVASDQIMNKTIKKSMSPLPAEDLSGEPEDKEPIVNMPKMTITLRSEYIQNSRRRERPEKSAYRLNGKTIHFINQLSPCSCADRSNCGRLKSKQFVMPRTRACSYQAPARGVGCYECGSEWSWSSASVARVQQSLVREARLHRIASSLQLTARQAMFIQWINGVTPMLEMIKTHLQTSVPFAAYVGVRITSVDSVRAEAALDERAELTNHIATMHAGALFTLAEAASGAAMAGALAPVLMQVRPVASKGTIAYLKPAKGNLVARAVASRPAEDLLSDLATIGKTEFGVAVTIHDASDVAVATVEIQWHVRSNGRAA